MIDFSYRHHVSRLIKELLMWKTCQEIVSIADGLKALLASGIAALLSELKPHCAAVELRLTGIRHFDALTREQQVRVIHEIALALLRDDVLPPEPVAYRQATLLAVLDCINRGVFSEILEQENVFRTLILKAHRELYGAVDHGVTVDCPDADRWQAIVLSVRKKMLDDWTLEISDKIIDLPPGLTDEWLNKNNIPQDYFIVVPVDSSFFQTAALALKTYELCADYLMEYMRSSNRQTPCPVLNN